MKVDADLPDYPTIVHALEFAARHAPERTALVCEDRELSYAQYGRAVAGLAGTLRERGAAGSRVVILMANSIEMSVACLGGMAAGAQIAPMNPGYTEREMTPLLRDSEPAVILCGGAQEERARARAAELGIEHVLVIGEGGIELERWIDDPDLTLPEELPGAGDPAAIFFTGGTTGVPKGAEHDHAMMMWFCRQIFTQWRMDFDTERILTVAPIFHIWGHHFANIAPLYLRATLIMLPQYRPEAVLRQFEHHAITVFAGGPPTIYIGLLARGECDTTDFSALKYSMGGGAPFPSALLGEWERRTGCIFLENSGMSEGAPLSGNPSHGARKPLSAGAIPPETEMDIVDIETGTNILAPHERGEVRVRGPQFTRRYRNRPEETAAAIRDGWLYTGDIGYLDDDGYLFLVDRKKEMILVGGFSVYPREIDEVLFSHPAVHEAAAVGFPDDFKGEVVKAFVAIASDRGELTEQDLIAWCAERLVDYKVPVAIEILDALPKTGPGKIDKLALKGAR
jgi:long-chain acyl-CoA synthetase